MATSQPRERRFDPVPVDVVVDRFLRASRGHLAPDIVEQLDAAPPAGTWLGKIARRAIADRLEVLDHFVSREWFDVDLSDAQTGRVFLGHEAGDDFSHFYSDGTYRLDRAAAAIVARTDVEGARKRHRDAVLAVARDEDASTLEDVMLCVSRYVLNRRLKVLDGNHRVLGHYIRDGGLAPFRCLVGFDRRFVLNIAGRAVLGFPFRERLLGALAFHLRKNLRRLRGLVRGGEQYQPMLRDGTRWARLTDLTLDDDEVVRGDGAPGHAERGCVDRARAIHRDLQRVVGDVEGRSLLDIGCNIGFFCHYFASLGAAAVGVDNSQHNRHQRFSLANSIELARRLNVRYGLEVEFHDADARAFLGYDGRRFDVVLLLSVIHHFFLGYGLGDSHDDPMHEARAFLESVADATLRVLYIEYEPSESVLSLEELLGFLRASPAFERVEVFGDSGDFGRPMIRCERRETTQ